MKPSIAEPTWLRVDHKPIRMRVEPGKIRLIVTRPGEHFYSHQPIFRNAVRGATTNKPTGSPRGQANDERVGLGGCTRVC
jgi:hypothetical protein